MAQNNPSKWYRFKGKDEDFVLQLYRYAKENQEGWGFWIILFIIIEIISFWAVDKSSPWKGLLDNIGTGFFAAAIFSIWQDFSLRRYLGTLTQELAISQHIGTKLHPNHDENRIDSRKDLMDNLLHEGGEFKLLTTTAASYFHEDELASLKNALRRGVRVKFLLYTPLLYLRGYVLLGAEDQDTSDTQVHGEYHHHSSEIIIKHSKHIFPALRILQSEFPENFLVRVLIVRPTVNLAIFDKRRIICSPQLSKTFGNKLPCLDIYPGLVSMEAFATFEKEFNSYWDGKDFLELNEVTEIYDKLFDMAAKEFITARFSSGTDDAVRELVQKAKTKKLQLEYADS